MFKLSRFFVICLTIVILLSSLLFNIVSAAGEEIEITMWFGRNNFIPGDAFEQFHKEYPNIHVKTDVIRLEQSVADFIRAASAGKAPDLLQVPGDSIGPLAQQGLLLDMTELFSRWQKEDPKTYNGIAPLGWSMPKWNGIPHGVALHIGPFWYVYRKDLFEKAGIPHPPKTWDDVLEAGRKLSVGDTIGFSIIGSRAHDPVWFLSLFMAMGGQFENNVPQLNSEAGIYLLSFYQTLMRDKIASSDTLAWNSGDMRAAFIGGNAAQALIGDNIFPTIQEAMQWNDKWSAVPPPVRPGAESEGRYMALGWPYLVYANTKYPYEASLVLRYLSRPEIISEVSMRYQPTTVVKVLNLPEYKEAKPWAPDFEEAFNQLVPLPGHGRQPAIYRYLLDAMQEAISNPNDDPAEIAQKYQDLIDKETSR